MSCVLSEPASKHPLVDAHGRRWQISIREMPSRDRSDGPDRWIPDAKWGFRLEYLPEEKSDESVEFVPSSLVVTPHYQESYIEWPKATVENDLVSATMFVRPASERKAPNGGLYEVRTRQYHVRGDDAPHGHGILVNTEQKEAVEAWLSTVATPVDGLLCYYQVNSSL
jgi:hypothetical protein